MTGKINGKITDEEKTPLPGVTVEISSPSLMGGVHSQVTSGSGDFRFINLPPGIYKLKFSLDGFQTVERQNVKISLNTTVTEDMIMKQSTVEESIVVTGEAPVVDVTKSGVNVNFTKDQMEDIPGGRFSVYDIIKQTPAIPQQDQREWTNTIYGSNTPNNAYLVDGIDISSPGQGHGWNWQPQDMFEEVEVSGIGAPAEYGNFTGAVINIVTKSGGNTFSGGFGYYGQFQSLTGDNNPKGHLALSIPPDKVYSYNRDKYLNASFNLGGPIVKDRLWFFGLYERNEDSYSAWLIDPKHPNKYLGNKAVFKLSSQLSKKHRLVGSYYYEDQEFPESPDEFNLPETVNNEKARTNQWTLLYTFQISNNAFLELKYSGWRTFDDYLPSMGGDINAPVIRDGYSGVNAGAPGWNWKGKMSRDQANANFTYFAEDFLGGDHDFKVGIQYTRGTSEWLGGYSGGKVYYLYDGSPRYLYEYNPFKYGATSNNIGAFVDDSWTISGRLTVNLGLRFDHNDGSIPSWFIYDGWQKTSGRVPGFENILNMNVFAPRFGLAYQLTSDHKTLLKASYGRYYEATRHDAWSYPGPAVSDYSVSYWDGSWVPWYTIPGEMGYIIDPKLKNPYADTFSLGLERELRPNLSVGATFIYKKEKDLIGWEDRGATYEQISLVSPDNGKTYTVFNKTSDLGSTEYWITNPSRYGQTYKALIFSFAKRHANNWQLFSSLTWSKAEGINIVSNLTTSWALATRGKFGKDPNDYTNAGGPLSHDRTWIFKLQASYSFPWGIMASMNFLYQTGRPIPMFTRIYPDQGQRQILAEQRGPHRYKPWNLLDFRLQKTFNIHKSLRLDAMIDVFNLLNSATVTDYRSLNLWAQAYNEPSSMFNPRRLQIGLKMKF
ncbi:TonB-dependent receptor [bacterium]|nr:MAG: TonB-dependent receptor [bacterium]